MAEMTKQIAARTQGAKEGVAAPTTEDDKWEKSVERGRTD